MRFSLIRKNRSIFTGNLGLFRIYVYGLMRNASYSQSAFTFVPTKTCSGARYQDRLGLPWKEDQRSISFGFVLLCFAVAVCASCFDRKAQPHGAALRHSSPLLLLPCSICPQPVLALSANSELSVSERIVLQRGAAQAAAAALRGRQREQVCAPHPPPRRQEEAAAAGGGNGGGGGRRRRGRGTSRARASSCCDKPSLLKAKTQAQVLWTQLHLAFGIWYRNTSRSPRERNFVLRAV